MFQFTLPAWAFVDNLVNRFTTDCQQTTFHAPNVPYRPPPSRLASTNSGRTPPSRSGSYVFSLRLSTVLNLIIAVSRTQAERGDRRKFPAYLEHQEQQLFSAPKG